MHQHDTCGCNSRTHANRDFEESVAVQRSAGSQKGILHTSRSMPHHQPLRQLLSTISDSSCTDGMAVAVHADNSGDSHRTSTAPQVHTLWRLLCAQAHQPAMPAGKWVYCCCNSPKNWPKICSQDCNETRCTIAKQARTCTSIGKIAPALRNPNSAHQSPKAAANLPMHSSTTGLTKQLRARGMQYCEHHKPLQYMNKEHPQELAPCPAREAAGLRYYRLRAAAGN